MFALARPTRLVTLTLAVLLAAELGAIVAIPEPSSGHVSRSEPEPAAVAPDSSLSDQRRAGRVDSRPAAIRPTKDGSSARAIAVAADAMASAIAPREHPPTVWLAPARPVVPSTVRSTTTIVPNAPTYRGRNHVWIPSLGINRAVSAFPCSRSRPPDNDMYRWGCAGANNVYLMGHAHGVLKPLHDAFVGGRLRKGMKVLYADGNGRVRTYAVSWWKTTRPTTSASWAWAAQSRPSMTIQTCVGSNNEFRLMVRLLEVG
jgi:hypothetical protein